MINQGSDNTAIRVLGEVENIGDDEVRHFAKPFRALIGRILPPNWTLSGQAQSNPLEFGVTLGSVLSAEQTPSYFAVFNDLDKPSAVDVFQPYVVWFSDNHIRDPFHQSKN
ncbi:hypothetical protein [Mesorhizobium sp. 128a]